LTSDKSSDGIFLSRLKIITDILKGYNGTLPFHRYLKTCFSVHRNFGSSDRRLYSAYSHGYFRLGRALKEVSFEQRLAVAAFLTQETETPFLKFLISTFWDAEFLQHLHLSAGEKMDKIQKAFPSFNRIDMTPLGGSFSEGMNADLYAQHLPVQPLVWIRIRKGREQQVLQACRDVGMEPQCKGEVPGSFGFISASKLTELDTYKKGAFEIQDHSSQLAGSLVPLQRGASWWDCCCGAGGKSLQLLDREPGLRLTASDVRDFILENFRERLKRNRVSADMVLPLDLAQPIPKDFENRRFDGILADVPCSGSGTWGRSPEQLTWFNPDSLPYFSNRQLMVLDKIQSLVKPGGVLVYLTCSIYSVENEQIVNKFLETAPFTLEKMQLVTGFEMRADSMFIAVLRRN
jgi:16S rRNA (cytosine967-C5)-methyltransferase